MNPLVLVMVCSAFILEGPFAVGSAVDCAVGFVEQGQECVCASDDHLPFNGQVVCGHDGNSSRLRYITCVTPKTGNESMIVAGICPFYELNYQQFVNLTIQDELPFTGAELDEYLCFPVNRTGSLCGQCVNGTAINIHSFMYQCIPDSLCGDLAWLWYLLGEIVPLTLFFAVIIVFQPTLVSPSMNAFVLAVQLISLPATLSSMQVGISASSSSVVTWPAYVVLAMYGVFNIQFLWVIVPTLCIGSQYNILTVLALQYVTALYPLFLCALLLVPVELYHHNFRPLVYICKPVLKCLSRLRNRLNLDSSLPKCLASLFLLSYIKICNTSISLLLVVPQYDAQGQLVDFVLYLDGSVSAFSSQHLPYAVLAMTMLTVFVLAPIALLMLYQWKPLEGFLHCRALLRRNAVPFIELFQGGLKDGKDGYRDLRLFAGIYFVIRVIGTLVLILAGMYLLFSLLAIVLTIALSGVFFILRPYKDDFYNYLDGLFFLYGTLMLSLYMYTYILLSLIFYLDYYHVPVIILNLLLVVPILYLSGLILCKIAQKENCCFAKIWSKFVSKMNNSKQEEDYLDLEELRNSSDNEE